MADIGKAEVSRPYVRVVHGHVAITDKEGADDISSTYK